MGKRHRHHGDGQDVCTAAGAVAGGVIGGVIDDALGGNGQVGEVIGGVAGAIAGHKECDDGSNKGGHHGHGRKRFHEEHYHPKKDLWHSHPHGPNHRGTHHHHHGHHSSVDVEEQFDKNADFPGEKEEQIAAIAGEMGTDNPEVVAGAIANLEASNEASFKVTA